MQSSPNEEQKRTRVTTTGLHQYKVAINLTLGSYSRDTIGKLEILFEHAPNEEGEPVDDAIEHLDVILKKFESDVNLLSLTRKRFSFLVRLDARPKMLRNMDSIYLSK